MGAPEAADDVLEDGVGLGHEEVGGEEAEEPVDGLVELVVDLGGLQLAVKVQGGLAEHGFLEFGEGRLQFAQLAKPGASLAEHIIQGDVVRLAHAVQEADGAARIRPRLAELPDLALELRHPRTAV